MQNIKYKFCNFQYIAFDFYLTTFVIVFDIMFTVFYPLTIFFCYKTTLVKWNSSWFMALNSLSNNFLEKMNDQAAGKTPFAEYDASSLMFAQMNPQLQLHLWCVPTGKGLCHFTTFDLDIFRPLENSRVHKYACAYITSSEESLVLCFH